MKKNRSFGVTFFSVIMMIGGINTLLPLFGFSGTLSMNSLVLVVLGLIFLVIGIGLFKLNNQVRKLAIYFFLAIPLLNGLWATHIFPIMTETFNQNRPPDDLAPHISTAQAFFIGFFPAFIYSAVFIFFFTRQRVKEQFSES